MQKWSVILLGVILLCVPVLWGQSTIGLTGMPETTVFAPTDILYVVLNPGTTPLSRKITAANLLARVGGCSWVVGNDDPSGSALTDAQLGAQGRQCLVPSSATVVQVTVAADAGTPSVLLRRRRPLGNSTADLTSSALATAAAGGLACSRTGAVPGIDGTTACIGTLQNTALASGDWLEVASGTAGGSARRMSIAVTWAW